MTRPVTALAALLAALLLAGCAGDDSPGDREEIRASLAAVFAGDHPEDTDLDAGQCFAEAFTDSTSTAAMADGGLLDDDGDVVEPLPALTPALAEKWVDAQFGCTDFVEESTRAQVKVSKGRIDAEAYAACLADDLSEQEMRDAVQATLEARWDSAELSRLSQAQTVCYDAAMPPDPA